jgi:predicted nucleic acid-binding protein
MDRVFLDANILYSASYREGAGLTRLWKLRDVQLLTSAYALGEAWRNIDDAAQRVRLASLAATLELVGELPVDAPRTRGAGLPAKDVPILNAAISGRATHLLTADEQHFGRLFGTTIGGVLIVSPADYLRGKRRWSPFQALIDMIRWLRPAKR